MRTEEEIRIAIRFYEHLLILYKSQEEIKKAVGLTEAERQQRMKVERDKVLLEWVLDDKSTK